MREELKLGGEPLGGCVRRRAGGDLDQRDAQAPDVCTNVIALVALLQVDTLGLRWERGDDRREGVSGERVWQEGECGR